MYRLQENVPDYLINESRDFQLLCRLYDCNNNGVKFSIDSIVRVMNTTTCGSSFIKLLETRLGLFTNGQYTDSEIRDILFGFCDMIKYKGTELGVARAVRSFLVAKNVKVPTEIIYNKEEKAISIGLKTRNLDTSLLEDILRYVMPAGCYVNYLYYIPNQQTSPLTYGQRVIWVFADDKNTSKIVSSYDKYTANYAGDLGLEYSEAPFINANSSEKNAINNMLSNVGFTNIYSKSGDDTGSEEHWDVKTVDDTITNNS